MTRKVKYIRSDWEDILNADYSLDWVEITGFLTEDEKGIYWINDSQTKGMNYDKSFVQKLVDEELMFELDHPFEHIQGNKFYRRSNGEIWYARDNEDLEARKIDYNQKVIELKTFNRNKVLRQRNLFLKHLYHLPSNGSIGLKGEQLSSFVGMGDHSS